METGIDLAAGQVLVGGTYGLELSRDAADRIRAGRLGGLVLMGRNVQSAAQVRSLLGAAVGAAPAGEPPPLLAVDQEGGRVARIRAEVLQLPPARALGRASDPDLTRAAHAELGRQLAAIGFTVDFAPVLDVDGGPERGIVGDRAFSGDPAEAGRHGAAAIEGLLGGGLCPCGKHFPGHGSTRTDSHHELPRVALDEGSLRRHHLPPFLAGLTAGLPMVMTAHVVYEALDPDRPATCSRSIVTGLLRDELGFDGVVASDDLTMGAVAVLGGPAEVAVEALVAGVDLLLVCHDEELQERVRAALAEAARRSPAVRARLEEAASRVRSLRDRFRPAPVGLPDLDESLGGESARALSRTLGSLVA